MNDLRERFEALGWRATASQIDDIIATATKKRWGTADLFEHVASIEEKDRTQRGLERRTKTSKLPKFRPLADFDWNWPTRIDRTLTESVAALDFVETARNVLLIAPAGLGKTMIAQNIVHRAILAGHTALFISATEMLLDLASHETARTLENRLRYYARVGILVIDEVGFVPFDSRNADLLFQVVSRRYEKRSIVLTTNLAFGEWNTIFPNAACATALIERLIHHSDIITITGESYRLREAEKDAQARRASRGGKDAASKKKT